MIHFQDDHPVEIDPVESSEVDSLYAEKAPLMVAPGTVILWKDQSFYLEAEGRYCVSDDTGFQNILVFKDDYHSLFHALSQIHIKGERHRSLSHEERIETMRRGRLSVMCGGITSVTLALLKQAGHRARRISMVSLEAGGKHVVFEYFAHDLDQWIVVDIHNHALPTIDDRLISLLRMVDTRSTNTAIGIRRLSKMGGLDYFSWDANGSGQFGLGSETILYDDATASRLFTSTDKAWGIWESDELCYFPADTKEETGQITDADERFRCLPMHEWSMKFYSNCTPRDTSEQTFPNRT